MTHAVREKTLEAQDAAHSEWPESAEAIYLSGGVWSTAPDLFEAPVHTSAPHEERYQLTCLLGQGGMGQVWLGWDQRLQRQVAIKRPFEDEPGGQAARLTYEAMITARLEHPGIVSIYDMYTADDVPHFVMRLVRGQPLARHIESHHESSDRQPLPSSLIRHLLYACEAIAHAHRRGICHRDLSPMNILISDEGATHLIDWGLACRVDELDTRAHHVGTPGYIAPEQSSGPRADVWSLGAVLFHILHGHAPAQHFTTLPSSPSPELDAILACALAHEPARRYQDATALAHELQRWFEGQRIDAYHVTPWRSFVRVARMYRGRIGLALLVMCALLGSIAAGVMSTREEARRAREAEQLAHARREHANQESIKARHAAARLIYKDAQTLADEMDLVNARRRALESLATHDNPDARGLLAALAAYPKPSTRQLMTLPECHVPTWSLTSDPREALCYGMHASRDRGSLWSWYVQEDPAKLATHNARGEWRWRREMKQWGEFHTCSPKYVRGDDTVLRVHAHPHPHCLHHYMELDATTGELIHSDRESGAFAVSSDTLRLHDSRRYLIGLPDTREVCRDKILNAARRSDDEVWLICGDYEVWRVLDNQPATRVPVAPEDRTHSLIFHPETQQPWLVSTHGNLFVPGESHISWTFGESIKEMRFLPGTSLLVMLGLRGKLRVFDTSARRWRYTMPDRYSDIAVDRGAHVRAIRHDDVVVQWSFDTTPRIARYRGSAGFAMAAWSREQDLVLGLDGQGRVHMFEPETGKLWEPYPWSEHVGKWVAASPRSNSFHIVGIKRDGIYTVSRDDDGEMSVRRDPRFLKRPSTYRRMMISPDELALFVHYGEKGVDIEQVGSGAHESKDLNIDSSAPYDADTSSQHRFVVLASANNITRWDWRSELPDLVHTSGDAVNAVSVNEQGAVLIAKKDELLVFDEQLVHTHSWPIEGDTILDVEWLPRQHTAVLAHLDGRVTFWDTRTGELLARGSEHTERVTKVDVTRDGRRVLTTGWDGMIAIWDVEEAMRPRDELVGLAPRAHPVASSP